MMFGIILMLIMIVVFIYGITTCRQLSLLEKRIRTHWRMLEELLKQRLDFIPNIVAVASYGGFPDKDLLISLTELRSATLMTDSIHARSVAEKQVTAALHALFTHSLYQVPLRSNQSFLDLQQQIIATQEAIKRAMVSYNNQVHTYRTYIHRFPSALIARIGGFSEAPVFEIF